MHRRRPSDRALPCPARIPPPTSPPAQRPSPAISSLLDSHLNMSERGAFRGRGGGARGADRGSRGGGRGGHGGGGQTERPKKENILDLGKYMDKELTVKFSGGREGMRSTIARWGSWLGRH